VPHRLSSVTTELSEMPWENEGAEGQFRAISRLTSALYHFEFHEREQTVLSAWDRVNDEDGDDAEAANTITAELTGLLNGANYSPITTAELDEALDRESLIPLKLEVDLNDYDEVLIYHRGSHQDTVDVPKWKGLRSEQKTIRVDERVVVHTRVKNAAWFESVDLNPADRNLVPGHVSLKQFRNVPRADIEMLLPSTQVRFRLIDSILVGVPAVVTGIVVLATKLLPTLGLIFLLLGAWLGFRDEQPTLDQTSLVILFGGAITLGGFLFRQWTKLKNRRVDYLKTLSENLYFRTLGDGPGVIHTLLAGAEEQEIVEVLIAYRFLLTAPDGLSTTELDTRIETWLLESCQRDIDFEIDDALAKLRRLGLVEDQDSLRPCPLDRALELLDRRWDELFDYHSGAGGSAPDSAWSDGDSGNADGDGGSGGFGGRLIQLRQVVGRFSGRLGQRRNPSESEAAEA